MGQHRDHRDGVHHVPALGVQHALDRAPRCGPKEVAQAAPPYPTPTGGSPRVLILFSDTGGGHRAAAHALTEALRLLDPTCAVTVADPLIGEGPAIVRRLASLYSPVIRRSRAAWGAVYHSSNTQPTFAAIRAVFGPAVRGVLRELIRQHDPDVVLSVHPLLNHVAHQAIRTSGRPRALMTVITDLVDFHRGWTFSQADLVVAPTERARRVALRRRVPPDRVKLLGLPVDLRFRPPAPGEKQALRRRFGLDENRFTVLVIGGAAGVGHLAAQVRALALDSHPWQLVVVCGRNDKLRRRLLEIPAATPMLILGFVDYMPELMRACDLVVTKAGPGAIAEALATGLPLVITGFLPGQESPNVDFVVESHIGFFAPKESDLLDEVRVLAEGGPTWREMSANAEELAHPYASSDIARECLLLAARYRASEQASR
ncbi:MAG TPA: glycosyltransferase [Candidatus Dormibacteraeota bacterium]|nr:glycosyltransferase [Candidatus Dormibacteraeota bacterium]